MSNHMGNPSKHGLEHHGIRNVAMEYWTLPTPPLIERIVSRREGMLAHEGGVVVRTGHHTGRAPNDKFIVKDESTEKKIWWGKVNQPMLPEHFDRLHLRMTAYFQGRDVFVQDVVAANHPEHHLPIRVITENAWHSLFARNMFVRVPFEDLEKHVPQFTVIQAPHFHAHPEEEGTNSETFIVVNFAKRLVLIGGTSYAGEIKKSIFSVLNFLLPQQNVMPMHCSANVNEDGQVALFFGLSGTGKTTLSSDPDRKLIGDDEHGWGKDGVFNFEGGCYAKAIRLDPALEPMIWQATRHFGSVLENVCIDANTRRVDYDDDSYTENTRVSYPLGYLGGNIVENGRAGHPTNIFFLTADAFGVLPPLARLTKEQAMYYFLSGYTSKLAGTEKGLGNEPQATFSACFGAPFLPLHPTTYATMLGERLNEHDADVWLVNTGWTGGPYGTGERIKLPYTRAMLTAALNGKLKDGKYRTDPHFGLSVPVSVPGVPDEILDPGQTWADKEAYAQAATAQAKRFMENFKQYKDSISPEIFGAGPTI